jgi:hypothetical protein
MKRPKWTDEEPDTVVMSHEILKRCAMVLRIDAKLWRKVGNRDAAFALGRVAVYLDQVASGNTWAEAFGWPAVDEKVK